MTDPPPILNYHQPDTPPPKRPERWASARFALGCTFPYVAITVLGWSDRGNDLKEFACGSVALIPTAAFLFSLAGAIRVMFDRHFLTERHWLATIGIGAAATTTATGILWIIHSFWRNPILGLLILPIGFGVAVVSNWAALRPMRDAAPNQSKAEGRE